MASVSHLLAPIHLGLDVHRDTISVGILTPDQQVPDVDRIAHDEPSVRRLVGRLGDPRWLRACYEAGPTGLELARLLHRMHVRCETIRLLAWKGLTDIERYGQPGPEGSLVKWLWSDTNQRLSQLAADILGEDAAAWDSPWTYRLLRSRANSIEGGTTEILKNILAERVLGLPKAR